MRQQILAATIGLDGSKLYGICENQQSSPLKRGIPFLRLRFFHIPIPEYDEVWDFHTCYGMKYENVCAPQVNTGFFCCDA